MNKLYMYLTLSTVLVLLAACGSGSSSSDSDVVGDGECGTVVDISENAMVSGRLEDGDCTVNQLIRQATDIAFTDEYRVTIATGGTLVITMRSAEIDSFLGIVNTATSCSGGCDFGLVLLRNDDSGGGVNGEDAQITIMLAPGTYLIHALSSSRETGNYTLETTFM